VQNSMLPPQARGAAACIFTRYPTLAPRGSPAQLSMSETNTKHT